MTRFACTAAAVLILQLIPGWVQAQGLDAPAASGLVQRGDEEGGVFGGLALGTGLALRFGFKNVFGSIGDLRFDARFHGAFAAKPQSGSGSAFGAGGRILALVRTEGDVGRLYAGVGAAMSSIGEFRLCFSSSCDAWSGTYLGASGVLGTEIGTGKGRFVIELGFDVLGSLSRREDAPGLLLAPDILIGFMIGD